MGTEGRPPGRPNVVKLWKGLNFSHKLAILLLILTPLMVIVIKALELPGSEFLKETFTLGKVSASMRGRVSYVLIIPLAAAVVVFFRLTLGVRLLGPFRSILLSLAFNITGIPIGILFLILVVSLVVLARPLLKGFRLAYFARISVILSLVSVVIIAALIVGRWFDYDELRRASYFPIVVLCLTADGFAKTVKKEGFPSALWLGAATALVAVVITGLWKITGLIRGMIRYPELLMLQVGVIIIIAKFFDFRLLQNYNLVPFNNKKESKKKQPPTLKTLKARQAKLKRRLKTARNRMYGDADV